MALITEIHINPSAYKAVIDKIITDNRITSQFSKKAKFIPNTRVPEGLVIFLDSSREIHSTFSLDEEEFVSEDDPLQNLDVVGRPFV
jgi:hypothetical protein